MRSIINQNFKGVLGEVFVKQYLEINGIKTDKSTDFYNDEIAKNEFEKRKKELDKKGKDYKPNGKHTIYRNGKKVQNPSNLELYNTFQRSFDESKIKGEIELKIFGISSYPSFDTTGFPDFRINRKNIFVEVKTGKFAQIQNNQTEQFSKLVRKGFIILIANPILEITATKFELKEIKWQLYNSKKSLTENQVLETIKNNL